MSEKNYKYTLIQAKPLTDVNKVENIAWKMFTFLALGITVIVYSSTKVSFDLELENFSDGSLIQTSNNQTLNSTVSNWTPNIDIALNETTTITTTEKLTTQQVLHNGTTAMDYESEKISNTTPKIRIQKATPTARTIKKLLNPEKFYVNTDHCHMVRIDPFSPASKKIFKPGKYKDCGAKAIVTSAFNETQKRYILNINYKNIEDILCCYQHVIRSGSGSNADKNFKLLPCVYFNSNFTVPQQIDAMIVVCKSRKTKKTIQKDALSFIQERNGTASIEDSKNGTRKPSVLLIGIDSLSRSNFRRNMPKTAKFLKETGFFELEGYNKIGDNTFPNLMALMTGRNQTEAYSKCNPKSVGGLENCNFIWKEFKAQRYATAYGEDECWMSTFNYLKKGFANPPTDYYLRPMMLAGEKNLEIQKKSGLYFCLGRRHSAEHVYDFAFEFAKRSQQRHRSPGFGLFWTNSFSHNSFEIPSTMDLKMHEYFENFKNSGVLDTSIVLFFSDHGMRWGPLLKLPDGFLEERLPMFFIWLPKWFQQLYADYIEALKINRNRLTTPFDIYRTLKHILDLNRLTIATNRTNENQSIIFDSDAESCAGAQSLFFEVAENRTCSKACIPEHWCTCEPYKVISAKNPESIKVTNLIIDEINNYLKWNNFSSLCSTLQKSSIVDVYKMEVPGVKFNNETLRVKFKVEPKKAEFQATAIYEATNNKVHLSIADISRLDSYAPHSRCIDNKLAKKFCMCK